MDNTVLIEKLKERVMEWRNKEYEGACKETKNILRHIKKVNFLYTPPFQHTGVIAVS